MTFRSQSKYCTDTINKESLANRKGPRYLAIADEFSEAIGKGLLLHGDKLPTHRELADWLGVTVGTITRAYRELENRNLTSGEIGRGTFVKNTLVERSELDHIFPCLPEAEPDESLDLGAIVPVLADQPFVLGAALKKVNQSDHLTERLLRYPPLRGITAHREAGAKWVQQWLPDITKENIFVTIGAQQGLALAAQAVLKPGETLVAERLAWFGIKGIAAGFNLALEGAEIDDEGIVPESLEAVCREQSPGALFCSPTMHNPTSSTMSIERRWEIVRIAREYDLAIIEDGVFDFLSPEAPPAIASLAPERTIYVTSLSKCISAGLRVGFVCAVPELISRMAGLSRAMVITPPPLMGDVAALCIEDGSAKKLMEWQVSEFTARSTYAREVFGDHLASKTNCAWAWVQLPKPWTPGEFLAVAKEIGVELWAAEKFSIGHNPAPFAVRVALGGFTSRSEIENVLSDLADRVEHHPEYTAPGKRHAPYFSNWKTTWG